MDGHPLNSVFKYNGIKELQFQFKTLNNLKLEIKY